MLVLDILSTPSHIIGNVKERDEIVKLLAEMIHGVIKIRLFERFFIECGFGEFSEICSAMMNADEIELFYRLLHSSRYFPEGISCHGQKSWFNFQLFSQMLVGVKSGLLIVSGGRRDEDLFFLRWV